MDNVILRNAFSFQKTVAKVKMCTDQATGLHVFTLPKI